MSLFYKKNKVPISNAITESDGRYAAELTRELGFYRNLANFSASPISWPEKLAVLSSEIGEHFSSPLILFYRYRQKRNRESCLKLTNFFVSGEFNAHKKIIDQDQKSKIIKISPTSVIGKVFLKNEISETMDLNSTWDDIFSTATANILKRPDKIKTAVFLPLSYQQKKIGVLVLFLPVVDPLRQEINKEKLIFLQSIASLIISHSLLFSSSQKKLLELKKIAEDLQAVLQLSGLSQNISEVDKITQEIADNIPKLLGKHGFRGGILALVDERARILKPVAISSTNFTKKIIKVLPLPFKNYELPLNDENFFAIRALSSLEVHLADRLQDFISPPVSEGVALTVEKIIGFKCGLLIPIEKSGKVLGIIIFALNKAKNKVQKREIELAHSFAKEAATILDNSRLFAEMKRINKELETSNEYLREIDASKSEFISVASHQLRTPLSAIKGYLALILEGDYGLVPESLRPILKKVFQSNERLIHLVDNLLSASRLERKGLELQFSLTNISAMIKEIIDEFQPVVEEKELSLKMNPPIEEIPEMVVDKDKIRQVVVNLVDNAIKYTPQGAIEINLEINNRSNLSKEMAAKFGTRPIKKQYFRFIIKDTGIGLSAQDLDKVFGEFVRGKNTSPFTIQGTGLGLHIAREIVERHQGIIWAESLGEKKGSTFSFLLPITKD